MKHFLLTHSAFKCRHTGLDTPAGRLVFNEGRAQLALRCWQGAGATDATLHELSATEYRDIVLARLPQLNASR